MADESTIIRWTCTAKSGTMGAGIHKKKGRTTMIYTSAQANKLLKKLNDEHAALLDKENRSKDFRAAMGEDVESVRGVVPCKCSRKIPKNLLN